MKTWQKRALRTFIQSFVGTIATQLTVYQGQELTRSIIISMIASAIAGAISVSMNINEQ